MEQKELSELSDEDLLKYAKKMKNTKVYDAVILGFLVGIAIYSSVKNGLA